MAELNNVFAMIADEYREKGLIAPSDLEDLYLAERALDRVQREEEPTIALEDIMKRYGVEG